MSQQVDLFCLNEAVQLTEAVVSRLGNLKDASKVINDLALGDGLAKDLRLASNRFGNVAG